ncbi:MAG: V-type ATPase subunit, partial [Thermoplasmata archaeon]
MIKKRGISGSAPDKDRRDLASFHKSSTPVTRGHNHPEGGEGRLREYIDIAKKKIHKLKDFLLGDGNYAYAVARVKSRKQKLLSKDIYDRLLRMDIYEIIHYLSETDYGQAIHELATQYEGVELLEKALLKSLDTTHNTILSFCEGALKERLSLYLQRV